MFIIKSVYIITFLIISTQLTVAQQNQPTIGNKPPERIVPLLIALQNNNLNDARQFVQEQELQLTEAEARWVIEGIRYLAPNQDWIPLLVQLSEANPENAQCSYQVARAYWRAGELENCLLYCEESLLREPENPDILYGIAAIAFSFHLHDKAIEWVDQLLTLTPENIDGAFLKGTILARQGNDQAALDVLQAVLTQDPQHALAYHEVGKLYNRLRDPEQAEAHLLRSITLQPFFEEAYNALIVALSRQNRTEDVQKYQQISKHLSTWSSEKLNRVHYAFRNPTKIPPEDAAMLVTELTLINQEDMAKRYLEFRYENLEFSDPLRVLLARMRFNQGDHHGTDSLLSEITDESIQNSEAFYVLKIGALLNTDQTDVAKALLDNGLKQYPESEYLKQFATQLNQSQAEVNTRQSSTQQIPPATAEIFFVDVTQQAGLSTFTHRLGNSEKIWITDAMGSGVAVADYDNDGDDDIYFVNGRPDLLKEDPAYTNALFQNNNGTFTDVTQQAGVGDMGFGMCAVFGDIDNDGDLDLFVGNYGPNALYENQGDGTFKNITEYAGVGDAGYAAAAAFADFDHDGDLDLFVGNYVDFNPARDSNIRMDYFGKSVFMGPLHFDFQPDKLYVNDGTGKFTDIAEQAGINPSEGRAMGVVWLDLKNDGWLDLYVTNDSTHNHVLLNKGDGTFEDISLSSGGAFTESGMEGASMGVALGDYNNDQYPDIYITSYEKQPDVLFRTDEDGYFIDMTSPTGLMAPSRMLITWGVNFADFNADGWQDVITANGHMYPEVAELNFDRGYNQGINVYLNQEGKRFANLTSEAFPAMPQVSARGSALLDYDQDGDMDIVFNNIDSPPLLLENRSPQGNWLMIKLNATSSQTYGTRVVAKAGDQNWVRWVDGGSGYLSQNSATLHFGFGDLETIDAITIYWRHQDPQTIKNPKLNQVMTIDQPHQ